MGLSKLSLPKLGENSSKITNLINLISLNKVEKKAFICVFLISVLSLLSLIQANVLYIDDIKRVFQSDYLWNMDGRPLSSFANIALQLGKPLTDISPLPQILSLALYSLSSIYLGKIFRVNNLVFLSLGGIVFVLNPFNLQNFSYVFDSFTMGLAVFSSTAAFSMISIAIEKPLSNVQKIPVSFLILFLLISSLFLYQPATSIYIAACTFYSLLKLIRDATIRESVKGFIFSIAMLFFSLSVYITTFKTFFKNEYVFRENQIPSLEYIPETFIKNLLYSVKYLRKFLGNSNLSFLIFILLIVVILSLILLIFKQFRQNKNNLSSLIKLSLTILLALFYCFALIVSFYGINLVLLDPQWQPRACMGFSAVVGISCFFLAYLFYVFRFLRYFLIFFLCLLCLSFANISSTFGNTLHYQNTQEQIIATVLLSDLEEEISKLSNPPEKPKIAIAGQLKHSALTYQAFRKYPILKTITKSYFLQDWDHGHHQLRSLGFKFDSKYIKDIIPEEEKFMPSSQPILSRRIYDIYFENDDTFIILFKK